MNVGLVTLGCTKNQVDSEMILGLFKSKGFNIVNDPKQAEILIVNTCGFIESAKKEAIDTILEMAEYKTKAMCKYLIVTGCLAKRYKPQILETMPEVDLCIGVDEYYKIDEILSEFLNQNFLNHKLDFTKRIVSSNFPTCYIRISDGCDNRCSYCAIPNIRGRFKSREMEDIIAEVEDLASQGMQEFCIISQDTSRYGYDIYGEFKLAELLQKLSKIENVKWIRILYMYLNEITDELIYEIKNNDKICKYFDIPIQHASNKILKLMNRRDTKEKIYEMVEKIRSIIPDAILRTTVIVGFPGETDDDFNELKQAVIDLKFNKLGAFSYSKEEDTPAYSMKNQVLSNIKEKRFEEIVGIQKNISLKNNKSFIGKTYEVIIESISEDEQYFICRSYMDSPDVDGRIYLKIDENTSQNVIVGEFSKVQIIDYSEYDLFGKLII